MLHELDLVAVDGHTLPERLLPKSLLQGAPSQIDTPGPDLLRAPQILQEFKRSASHAIVPQECRLAHRITVFRIWTVRFAGVHALPDRQNAR